MKTIGVIPARMGSSRFPGKPLMEICGRPMIEHVYERSKMYDGWDALYMATCDTEIADFCRRKDYPVIMTADTHNRAFERVAEATHNCPLDVDDDDLVICVQGDEPMMRPDMIDAVVAPLLNDPRAGGSILAMDLVDDALYRNRNTVKIAHDLEGNVLYTSRAPIPYCDDLTPAVGAKRIYGIFGLRWHFLKWFISLPESHLEVVESCDSNRICDNGGRQKIAPYPNIPSFSVDTPADRDQVERAMADDPIWGRY